MARKPRRKTPVHVVRIPDDWWQRINEMKPDGISATEFIRQVILKHIHRPGEPLSVPQSHGGSRR